MKKMVLNQLLLMSLVFLLTSCHPWFKLGLPGNPDTKPVLVGPDWCSPVDDDTITDCEQEKQADER